MNRHPVREKSNIAVTVPDISAPIAQALEAFNKKRLEDGELPASGLTCGERGYVLTKSGMFVLDTDGIGPSAAVTPEEPLEVDLYAEYQKTDDGGSFSMVPSATIKLTDTELIMLPSKKEVPLEEFIRVFGGRLEENYRLWLESLRDNEPMTLESSS